MNDAKLLRFAAVVVVLAAYVFVFRAGEARVTERLAANAQIAARTRADERMLAARPRIEAERRRLGERLRAVELDDRRSVIVAHFLRDAARIAADHHATIPAITAHGPPNALAPVSEPHEPLQAIPLDITVEGRYSDVLAAMRALSRSRVLAAVDLASLARKHADSADPTLTAALHVVLQRLDHPNTAGRSPGVTLGSARSTDARPRQT